MIVAISISPSSSDATGGVADSVAEAVKVIRASGLKHETNSMFTNIEGEWVNKHMATTAPTYLKEIA